MAEARRVGSRRLWALLGLAVLLGYIAWLGAPYLRSVIVRDAAVTTWIDLASAPIFTSAKSAYERARVQPVRAPADAYVWSLIASPGGYVLAGAPIASWVNCSVMSPD